MSRALNKGMKVEVKVRRLVRSMGFHYRLQSTSLLERPDLVFPGRKKALFVHGCFWHRHENCALARLPKSRRDFWGPKVEGKKQRDIRNQEQLRQMKWRYLVVWECELRDTVNPKKRMRAFLESGP